MRAGKSRDPTLNWVRRWPVAAISVFLEGPPSSHHHSMSEGICGASRPAAVHLDIRTVGLLASFLKTLD